MHEWIRREGIRTIDERRANYSQWKGKEKMCVANITLYMHIYSYMGTGVGPIQFKRVQHNTVSTIQTICKYKKKEKNA